MAKKKSVQQRPANALNATTTAAAQQIRTENNQSERTTNLPEFLIRPDLHKWFIGLLAAILYANTLGHGYTLDDAIVIYDNMFTTKGISGIGGLLGNDTFYGFFKESGKAALVEGGRYRPLTPIIFALQWQIFGKNTFVGHLTNILFYAACCVMLYQVLLLWLRSKFGQDRAALMALLTATLFTVHPLHTEAVANIKGLDEIVTLLGCLGAAYLSWKAHIENKGIKYDIAAGVVFFLAFMSKENAVAWVALVPLSLRVFAAAPWEKVIKSAIPYIAGFAAFMVLRINAIGWQTNNNKKKVMELMNNPFLKIENNQWVDFSDSEKMGTVFLSLGYYLKLFLFPYQLSHDYYPRQIATTTLANPGALISLLIYGGLIYVAFQVFKKSSVISYGIAIYLSTLFVVSNIVFPIGTNMGERFVFMPSVGLCLALVGLLSLGWKEQKFKLNMNSIAIIGLVSLLFAGKTVLRNPDWKDDYTLFTTDVKVSENSAKLQNACGGAKFNKAVTSADTIGRFALLTESVAHTQKAVEIHPTYRNAYTIMGHSLTSLGRLDEAIKAYERSMAIDAKFPENMKGLAVAYRERGKYAGERENNLPKALEFINKSYAINAKDPETIRLMAVALAFSGQDDKALPFFKQAVEIDPKNPSLLFDCGLAHIKNGFVAEGQEMQKRAVAMDPKLQARLTPAAKK
jgi:protein O-mannosyl-transferase